jgi:7-cyano-7-deazaguanine synthase
MPEKIVMALSGGMDSTTMLGLLLSQGNEVHPVSFTYGSKHNRYENAAARTVAEYYNLALPIIDLSGVMQHFKSDLLLSGGKIPEGHYNDSSMERTVVPGRNMIFLSILAGYAWSIGATKIALGIHQGDHAIYADCRKEFFKAMDSAIYLGTDRRVDFIAPLLDMNKAGIVKIGTSLAVPFHLTRTCYKDQELSCGRCGSCRERLEAFEIRGIADPIKYQGE